MGKSLIVLATGRKLETARQVAVGISDTFCDGRSHIDRDSLRALLINISRSIGGGSLIHAEICDVVYSRITYNKLTGEYMK